MDYLIYKSFVWPRNPDTYQETWSRAGVYRKNDAQEDVFLGMDMKKCAITGTGVFFGETAYTDYKRLMELFAEVSPGNLEHPVFGIRYCYFTGFEMTQAPSENCIHYRFTFELAETNGILPK